VDITSRSYWKSLFKIFFSFQNIVRGGEKKIKKEILSISVSSSVLVMFALLFSMVVATKPDIAVSGIFYWTGAPFFDVYEENPNTLKMRGAVPLMYTGDFYGPAEGNFVWNLHYQGGPAKALATGRNFHTINVLAGFGDEMKTGLLTILLSNSNSQWKIISGTGAFENIHGTGIYVEDESTEYLYDYIYSGFVHFDP
jgi:hypothetical protein